jgi:hypothetical protein
MRLVFTRLFMLLLIGVTVVQAAAADYPATCLQDSQFKPIRGFCSNQYLRFDVLDEIGQDAKRLAYEKHFPLIITWKDDDLFRLAIQIRHDETPLRSRKWRGEFLILIRRETSGLSAEFVRAKSPLWPQVHRYLHEQSYARIAEAFARSSLNADDPAWAAEVRRLVPSAGEVVSAIKIERFATDDQACSVLADRVGEVARLTPEPIIDVEERATLDIQMHPESYEVVLANYPRLLYATDTEPKRALFKWAEGTVQALQTCWRPAPKPTVEE